MQILSATIETATIEIRNISATIGICSYNPQQLILEEIEEIEELYFKEKGYYVALKEV